MSYEDNVIQEDINVSFHSRLAFDIPYDSERDSSDERERYQVWWNKKKEAGSVLFTLSDLKMRYLLDKITVLIFARKQLSNQRGRVTFIFFLSLCSKHSLRFFLRCNLTWEGQTQRVKMFRYFRKLYRANFIADVEPCNSSIDRNQSPK